MYPCVQWDSTRELDTLIKSLHERYYNHTLGILACCCLDDSGLRRFYYAENLQVGGPLKVHSGTLAFWMESARGMYGLMSTTGVSSRASSPFTVKVQSLTSVSSTTQRPKGFGRDGLRQAKTPVSIFTECLLGYTRKVRRSASVSRR